MVIPAKILKSHVVDNLARARHQKKGVFCISTVVTSNKFILVKGDDSCQNTALNNRPVSPVFKIHELIQAARDFSLLLPQKLFQNTLKIFFENCQNFCVIDGSYCSGPGFVMKNVDLRVQIEIIQCTSIQSSEHFSKDYRLILNVVPYLNIKYYLYDFISCTGKRLITPIQRGSSVHFNTLFQQEDGF